MSLLFSVIIPTYNRAGFIVDAIESVLAQPGNDFEIIIVDDGSTDRTASVLRKYTNQVRLIRQENSGPGPARNRGAAEASGKYLAFLDSDDVWFPWTLQVLRQVIEESYPSFITSSPLEFRQLDELKHLSQEVPIIDRTQFDNFYASSDQFRFVGSGTMTISRKAFCASGGFTTEISVAEDLDLAIKLGTEAGYVFINAPVLLAYRKHVDSQVTSLDATLKGISYLVDQERAGNYPGGKRWRSDRLKILTRFCRSTSIAAVRHGRVKAGVHLYLLTFRWNLSKGRFRYLAAYLLMLALAAVRTSPATERTS